MPFTHSPQQWQATNIPPHIHSDTEKSQHTPARSQEQPTGTCAYTEQTGNTTCFSGRNDSVCVCLFVCGCMDGRECHEATLQSATVRNNLVNEENN